MSNLQGVVLGVVQGLTEFLPISSSAHLALTQQLMGLKSDAPELLVFDVVAHLATVLAMAIVFGGSFGKYLSRLVRETSPSFKGRRAAWRVAGLGVLASIPTALIGLGLKDSIEAAFGSPKQIAIELMITGVLLWATRWVRRTRRGWRRFGWWRAATVGVAQGVAIYPGISRSGATICVALFLGLKRRWAGEFSFFIAAPAILGAALLELHDHWGLISGQAGALDWAPLGFGAATAFINGVVALKFLLNLLRRGKLHGFAYYCWLVALVTLAVADRLPSLN